MTVYKLIWSIDYYPNIYAIAGPQNGTTVYSNEELFSDENKAKAKADLLRDSATKLGIQDKLTVNVGTVEVSE